MQTTTVYIKLVFMIFVIWTILAIFIVLLVLRQSQLLHLSDGTGKMQSRGITINKPKVNTASSIRYRKSNYIESNSSEFHINTLFDLPINFNYSSRNMIKKHKILWYNLPSWKNIKKQNKYLATCKVDKCFVTDDKNDVNSASAIIFAPTVEEMDEVAPVSRSERNSEQVWIFYSLEPPMNFRYQGYKSQDWLNTMNWSMTYRFDSDIFAPYGTFKRRSHAPKRDYRQLFLQKTKMAAWVVSHCGAESQRDDYVTELRKHGVEVDVFGKCSNKGFMNDVNMKDLLNKYKYFVAFENSFCKEYISCKVFRKYNLDLILIVRGGANYSALMPEGTYINTADFASIKVLADYLLKLSNDQVHYIRMLKKKDRFEALDEDSFGEKYAMCELCRKLNNVEKYRRTYSSMTGFLEDRQCWYPEDLPANITKRPMPRNTKMYIK